MRDELTYRRDARVDKKKAKSGLFPPEIKVFT